MNVITLKKLLENCSNSSKVIIFARTENNQYRPFENIKGAVINQGAFNECVHLDISVDNEYKSVHFPNNMSKEDVEVLIEQRSMLLEDLKEINEKLKGFKNYD